MFFFAVVLLYIPETHTLLESLLNKGLGAVCNLKDDS